MKYEDGGNSGGDNGIGNDGENDGFDGEDSEDGLIPQFVSQSQVQESDQSLATLCRILASATNVASSINARTLAFVQTVPTPIVLATISGISRIIGARVKAKRDRQVAKKKRIEAAERRKAEIEEELQQLYVQLASPMPKSATKLAERLYILVESDLSAVEDLQVEKSESPLYSAYLLGRTWQGWNF